MGRVRQQTIKVREYRAKKAGATKNFTSKQAAHEWAGRGSVEPYRLVVEDYELRCDEGGPLGPDDDLWAKRPVRLWEVLFTINGTANNAPWMEVESKLRRQATARRDSSYERYLLYLTEEIIGAQHPADFPPSAVYYARQFKHARFTAAVGDHERYMTRAVAVSKAMDLATVAELHGRAVDADRGAGRISVGTAQNAKALAGPWLKKLGDRRIDKVKPHDFRDWLATELSRTEGGTKRLRNAVGELSRVYDYSLRNRELAEFAPLLDPRPLQSELKGITRAADGASAKDVLTPDEVEKVITACASDFERACLALGLVGIRSGEQAGARWSDLTEELGAHWLQVTQTVVSTRGGDYEVEAPKDVKARARAGRKVYRHMPISARLMAMLEPVRGRGEYILGDSEPVQLDVIYDTLTALFRRAGVARQGIVPYSLRHTLLDATAHFAGTQYRDLLHRGDDDKSIANTVYTHHSATRFRQRLLMPDGRSCAEVLPWASSRF